MPCQRQSSAHHEEPDAQDLPAGVPCQDRFRDWQRLLEEALASNSVERRIQLELPGFLGLAAIVSTTDLLVTLPRQIGATLAQSGGLRVHRCPLPIPSFTVKQHWHARYHRDPANRWLRGVCADLFLRK